MLKRLKKKSYVKVVVYGRYATPPEVLDMNRAQALFIYRKGDNMNISSLTQKLENMFKQEAWGSKATLYGKALSEKTITRDEYNEARKYYGKMWNYAGD